MKIALIGDIHANLPALEAVLDHARANGVEENGLIPSIWNIGDLVGYGPFPDAVIRLVQAQGVLSIYGNYDRKVLQVQKKGLKTQNPEKRLAFTWADQRLTPACRAYLSSLPEQMRLDVHGWSILLCHGSPESIKEHLTPETPKKRLRELARMACAQVVICGHSHQPFARKIAGTWFVNTGSVGRPDDGDPRACYAILELEPDCLCVAHYRVEYDVERTVQAVRANNLPENFARMFSEGRDLGSLFSSGDGA
jgi:putative phosphoesterase